jgi:hypothetical protein
MTDLQQPPRSLVRTVPCSYCGANANDPCIGARGKERVSHHMERVLEAERRYPDWRQAR